MKDNNEIGWTEEMNSIHDTFHWHHKLLLFLLKLEFIDSHQYGNIQRSFERKTWNEIRNGDDQWQ